MMCNKHPYDLEDMSEFVAEGKPLPELAWDMSLPARNFIQAFLDLAQPYKASYLWGLIKPAWEVLLLADVVKMDCNTKGHLNCSQKACKGPLKFL